MLTLTLQAAAEVNLQRVGVLQGASPNPYNSYHLDATQNEEDEWEDSDSSYSSESEGLSSAVITKSMHFPLSPSWSPAKSES